MNDCSGREYHEATKHSWLSVRRNPNRLDWSRQPHSMKRYPERYRRIALSKEIPSHSFIYHIGGITAKKVYPGTVYYLRTNPSAGALYPNEIYFQSRGVEGFDDGIYHFEVAASSAVLLKEIDKEEGLEPFLKLRRPMKGLLFFVSSPWYRSAWKYRRRAYRYCLLDTGHILGAVEAGSYLYAHAYRVLYDTDLKGCNDFFGFGEEEFFLASAIAAVPRTAGEVRLPQKGIEQADPVGIFSPDTDITEAYRQTMAVAGCKKEPRYPKFSFNKRVWEETILKRRSVRAFAPQPIKKGEYEALMEIVGAPVPSDCDEAVQIYAVVNRVEGMEPGVYLGRTLLKKGDFSERAGYLCLEQELGRESAVTFFLLSKGCRYRPLSIKAGILGHRIYLASGYLGFGCSGIGAYYDDEVAKFLESDAMVLYALAVGHEKR